MASGSAPGPYFFFHRRARHGGVVKIDRQRLYRQRRFASRGRPLQPNAPGHVSYDACEMYDVDAVEAMLVRSRLFQRCPTLRTFQEGDVSNLAADAGPINGSYCRRYRDAAVATRASFNENPWELMRNNNIS